MAQMVLSSRCDVRSIRAAAWFAVAVFLLGAARVEALQADQANSSTLERQLVQDLNMIHAGDSAGLGPLKMGRLWARLAWDYQDALKIEKAEAAYNHALQLFETVPEAKLDYAVVLDNLGSLYLVSGDFDAAERSRTRSMSLRVETGDRLQIARGRAHLAEVWMARHKFKEADQEFLEAYRELILANDPDATDRVSILVAMTYASCLNRRCSAGLEYARGALSLAQEIFPGNSQPMGEAHLALGFAEWKSGIKEGPNEEMREGIEILKALMVPGHPYVLTAMEQYRSYLNETHRQADAARVDDEVKTLRGAQQKQCSSCTVSVYGLR